MSRGTSHSSLTAYAKSAALCVAREEEEEGGGEVGLRKEKGSGEENGGERSWGWRVGEKERNNEKERERMKER